MFYQPQYLQDVQGRSTIAAGLLILPITVPMVVFSPLSGRLIARFGARGLMSAGMLCGLGGVLVLTQVEVGSPYALLLAGYLLFGIALGLVYAPMSTAAMAAMPAEKAGIASGRAGDGPGAGRGDRPRRQRRRVRLDRGRAASTRARAR